MCFLLPYFYFICLNYLAEMDEPQDPKALRNASLTEDIVKNYIEYGQFNVQVHTATGRVGAHYRLLRDVFDEDNVKVPCFYYCPICRDVIQKNAANGTTPLTRHVEKCERKSVCLILILMIINKY